MRTTNSAFLVAALALSGSLVAHAQARGSDPCRRFAMRPAQRGVLALDSLPVGDARAVLDASLALYRAQLPMEEPGSPPAWAPGAEGRTDGRVERPDAYDVRQSPAAVAAEQQAYRERLQWDSHWTADGAELLCATTSVEGERARVRARVLVISFSGEEQIEEGARIELRRAGGRWLVHSLRRWREHYAYYDEQARYDAAFWRRWDAVVRRAERRPPTTLAALRIRVYQLTGARHLAGALQLALRVCDRADAAAGDCWDAEELAWQLGRGDDARRVRARALERAGAQARWFDAGACPPGTTLDRRAEASSDDTIVSCMRPNGERDGPATVLYPNGTPRQTGQYEDGFPRGDWLSFDDAGRVSGRARR